MSRAATVVTVSMLALGLEGCDPGPSGEALARTPSDATASAVAAAAGPSHVDRVDAVVRRVWSGEDFEFYDPSVSPDGRYAPHVSYADGELAVRDLRTGDRYPLTSTPNDVEGQRSAPGGASAFSPDGARVAYSWWLGSVLQVRVLDFEVGDDGAPVGPDCCALYAVPAAGGEPRRIEGIGALWPLSSGVQLDGDGQRLAFQAGQRLMEIWVMEGLGSFGGSR